MSEVTRRARRRKIAISNMPPAVPPMKRSGLLLPDPAQSPRRCRGPAGGSRRIGRRPSRSAAARSVSSLFWKQPPLRTTVLMPVSSASRSETSLIMAATVWWNRKAISGAPTPLAASAAAPPKRRQALPGRGRPPFPERRGKAHRFCLRQPPSPGRWQPVPRR